ncbi:hypothetical protein Tco_1146866 [Tanacetum coccineum]
MPPKRTSTSEAPAITQAAIRKLVADSVTTTLEAQAATMANADNTNRNTGEREPHVARKCLESMVMMGCCFVVERDALLRGVSGFGIGEVELSTFDVLQMFVFFLQMGFTLILATLDGLDVCLLGDVIGEDDGDEGE